jgi:hypothetical protein
MRTSRESFALSIVVLCILGRNHNASSVATPSSHFLRGGHGQRTTESGRLLPGSILATRRIVVGLRGGGGSGCCGGNDGGKGDDCCKSESVVDVHATTRTRHHNEEDARSAEGEQGRWEQDIVINQNMTWVDILHDLIRARFKGEYSRQPGYLFQVFCVCVCERERVCVCVCVCVW